MSTYNAENITFSPLPTAEALFGGFAYAEDITLQIQPQVPPTVVNFSPSVGTDILANTVLSFDVVDFQGNNPVEITYVIISAYYPDLGAEEVIFDGQNFGPTYTNNSNTVNPITAGFSFSCLRDGGWPDSPYINVYAVNIYGQVAT